MLKQLPVKKDYLLVAAAVLLLLISYQLAFKKTLEAWQLNKQLHAQLAQAADLSIQPAYLERKNANLSKIIGFYKTDTVAFRSNTISTISEIAGKLNAKLSEVPMQDPLYHNEQFMIQKLSFEGDFFALTRALNQLERTREIGVLRSLSFKKQKNNTGNNDISKLTLDVYFESLK